MEKAFSNLIKLYNAFVYGLFFLIPASFFIGLIFPQVELSEFLLIVSGFVLAYILVIVLFSSVERRMMGKMIMEHDEAIHSDMAIPCIYRFEEELMESYCIMKASQRHISFYANDGEVIRDVDLMAEEACKEKHYDNINHGISVIRFQSNGITVIAVSDQWEKFKMAAHIRVSEQIKSHHSS